MHMRVNRPLLTFLLLVLPAFTGCLEAPENINQLKVALGAGPEPAAPVVYDPPVAKAHANASFVLVGETILFSADGSRDPQGLPLDHAWDLGDGTRAASANVLHTYTAPGRYAVRLTVTNAAGLTDTHGLLVEVAGTDKGPVARAAATPAATWTDVPVTFTADGSFDPEGDDLRVIWDFGDGAAATSSTATHAFTEPGRHAVTLRVMDDAGAEATATLVVPVSWSDNRSGVIDATQTHLNGTFPVPEDPDRLTLALVFEGGAGASLGLEVRDEQGRLVDGVTSGPTTTPGNVTLALDLGNATGAWGDWTVTVVRHGGVRVPFALALLVGYGEDDARTR